LTPAGTLGAGIEYFLDDDISIGVEFKYLYSVATVVGAGAAEARRNG